MQFKIGTLLALSSLCHQSMFAIPYWDPSQLAKDKPALHMQFESSIIRKLKTVQNDSAIDVLRVRVDWQERGEVFTVANMTVEASGTPALLARSTQKPNWGSYLGVLVDKKTGQPMYYDSIGTGREFRQLTRAISLRFPVPENEMIFELFAENPQTGVMEKVVSQDVVVNQLQQTDSVADDVEIKEISLARNENPVRVNIYAEGYLQNEKNTFWQDAMKTVKVFQDEKFPGVENMSFYAVFHASNQKLGRSKNLGLPVPEYNSFLGLYYPYWDTSGAFSRWYNVVYPTREEKFREGLAVAAYDYPIVLVNNDQYWGVGNYMDFIGIPARNTSYFRMLVLHESGHFFGLNEEYGDGGGTELAFAPGIREPWSQNMTFTLNTQNSFENEKVKWQTFVDMNTPIPTPDSFWGLSASPAFPVYGAYRGGYGGTAELHGRKSYKPGLACMMDRAPDLCDVCKHAINEVVNYSRGLNSNGVN